MSIWISVGEPVMALDGHDDATTYRAEGMETLHVDIATTGMHDHTRLSVWSDDGSVDECVLLSPDAVEGLRAKLTTIREGES